MASYSLPHERVHGPSPAPKAWSGLASCLRELAWLLAAVAAALLVVALLAGVGADARGATLPEAMATPINIVRATVLAVVLWIWSYIQRAVRGVPARTGAG